MKKISLILTLAALYFCGIFYAGAQNVTITDDSTHSAHNSAILDVYSVSKGFLMPRLTSSQRTSIAYPATGLMVFDTDSSKFFFYDGSAWVNLMAIADTSTGIWNEDASNHYVYLNNSLRKVGVGVPNPEGKLVVKGDSINNATDTIPLFSVKDKDGNEVFVVYPRGVMVYVDTIVDTSGYKDNVTTSVTGFRVGKKTGSGSKGFEDEYFTISPSDNVDTLGSQARILWYPLKEAFLSGRVIVESPDSVGYNSWASGYLAKSIGDYSQALGYRPRAIGDYSTAIGNYALALGDNSFALGDSTIAGGGGGNKAASNNCYSFGKGSQATGDGSYAFGVHAFSQNNSSFALGEAALATGIGSYAIGSLGRDTLGSPLAAPTTAQGEFSFALGMGSMADSIGSFAIGVNSRTKGKFALSAGQNALASGKSSTAIGSYLTASGQKSLALGSSVLASNTYSIAIGHSTESKGYGAIALGLYNDADSAYSIAIGRFAHSGNVDAISIGENSEALGANSIAIGTNNISYDAYNVTFGMQSRADSSQSMAIGFNAYATNNSALSIGTSVVNTGNRALSIGAYSTTSAYSALSLGHSCEASADYSIAIGSFVDASAQDAISIGRQNASNGQGSLTAGTFNTANADYAVIFGTNNQATGQNSFTHGSYSKSDGQLAFAMGYSAEANGQYSFAFGSYTTAENTASFAYGTDALATGHYSLSFGNETETADYYGLAFGYRTTAAGQHSIAMGSEVQTNGMYTFAVGRRAKAMEYSSNAIGYFAEAKGQYSTAIGQYVKAKSQNCFVVGRYNDSTGTSNSWISTEPLFIVGNGTSDAARANAFTVFKNGQVKISGGSPGVGKVLTSGTDGTATWENLPGSLSSGSSGQTLRHNGTSWTANNLLYNDGNKIGIGTSYPEFTLTIRNDSDIPVSIHKYSSTTNDFTGLVFKIYGSTSSGYNKGAIFFERTKNYGRGSIHFATNNVATSADVDTSNIRMTITSEGYIGIGTKNPLSDFDILQSGGSSTAQETGGVNLRNSGYHWRIYNSNNFLRFNYSSDNGSSYTAKAYVNPTDGSWNQLSDISLKTNVHEVDNILEKLLQIRILSYNYKDNPNASKKVIGASANEVSLLFPEIVSSENNESLIGIDYSKFGVLSVKAIQEQQVLIETLQQQIKEMNTKYEELLNVVNKMQEK